VGGSSAAPVATAASLLIGRPVKWIEDRREHFISANQERSQEHEVEYAFDDNGILLAVRDKFLHDTGAYTPYGIIVPIITACTLPGPYRLRDYSSEFSVLYTNKVPVSTYRGAGRPHAVFVMERIMDRIASELHLDRLEVRSRNFIKSDEFPWDVGLVYQDGGPTRYDSGDYQAGLDKLKALLDYESFPARQAQAGGHRLGAAHHLEGNIHSQPTGQPLDHRLQVLDPDQGRLREAIAGRSLHAYAALEVALDEARPDFVCLATPFDKLFALARMALEAGVAVLVEKPIATTIQDADAMTAAAREAGDLNLRFRDDVVPARVEPER